MANYLYGRNDKFACAKQVSFDAIRHTGGTASLAASEFAYHNSFRVDVNRSRLPAAYKEAGAGMVYVDNTRAGRYSATASLAAPLFTASAAGIQPDLGPVFESAFGKAEVVADTSVTYSHLASGLVTCELWGMNSSNLRGVCAYGSLCNRLQITAGQDTADIAADFICRYAISQDRFANASSTEKGGLTSFPNVPANLVYTGTQMTGFTMGATLDAVAYSSVRSVTINMNMNRQYDTNHCATDGTEFYPLAPFEGVPEITFDISLWSTDSSDLTALLAKIENRTAFDAAVVIGNTAGGTYTFTLNNLIVPDGRSGFVHEDGDDRKAITISGLRAQATSTAVSDEITLVLT